MRFLSLIGKGIFFSLSLLLTINSHAGIITQSLGNTGTGLVNGDIVPVFGAGSISEIQFGQPAPFDQGYGLDIDSLLGSNDDPGVLSWSFSGFLLNNDPILGASLTIGIVDVDSMASGSQLDAFSVDGVSFTSLLDSQFESEASGEGEFNIFTINFDASFFASLLDDTVNVDLDIGGKGYITPLFGSPETDFNGVNLIYSTLTINTGTTPPNPMPVPEPSSIILFLIALLTSIKLKLHR